MKSIHERLLSRISVDASGCFNWTGGLTQSGYGRIMVSGRQMLAHRLSYEAFREKKVPDGLFVCHHCDNRKCVNPAHLFPGTPKQNTQDAVNKDRLCRGERHHEAKISDEQVAEMRRLYEGGMTKAQVARQFGVSHEHGWDLITNGRSHLNLPPVKNRGHAKKLSDDGVRLARSMRAEGLSYAEIGRRLGMTGHGIRRICLGEVRGAVA